MKERRAESEPEATVNQDPFPYLDSLPFPTPDLYKNITEVVKVRSFLSLKPKSKDMDKFYFIGIDVSKKKLDICVMCDSKVLIEKQVTNSIKVVTQAIKHIKRELDITNDMFIICAEHTGQYTYPLICATKVIDCKSWLENPTQIKYSCGMTRGKNDKIDARRIATYAFRFFDKMKCYVRPSEAIIQLNQLQAERSMYVADLAKYKTILTDQPNFIPQDIYMQKAKRIKVLMAFFQQAISALEKKMRKSIPLSNNCKQTLMRR